MSSSNKNKYIFYLSYTLYIQILIQVSKESQILVLISSNIKTNLKLDMKEINMFLTDKKVIKTKDSPQVSLLEITSSFTETAYNLNMAMLRLEHSAIISRDKKLLLEGETAWYKQSWDNLVAFFKNTKKWANEKIKQVNLAFMTREKWVALNKGKINQAKSIKDFKGKMVFDLSSAKNEAFENSFKNFVKALSNKKASEINVNELSKEFSYESLLEIMKLTNSNEKVLLSSSVINKAEEICNMSPSFLKSEFAKIISFLDSSFKSASEKAKGEYKKDPKSNLAKEELEKASKSIRAIVRILDVLVQIVSKRYSLAFGILKTAVSFVPSVKNESTMVEEDGDEEAEEVVEPVVPAVVEPVVEPVVPAVVEPVVEPVVPAVVEPVVEPVVPAVVEPVVEPVVPAVSDETSVEDEDDMFSLDDTELFGEETELATVELDNKDDAKEIMPEPSKEKEVSVVEKQPEIISADLDNKDDAKEIMPEISKEQPASSQVELVQKDETKPKEVVLNAKDETKTKNDENKDFVTESVLSKFMF